MKAIINRYNWVASAFGLLVVTVLLGGAACSDKDSPALVPYLSPATSSYRADVALSWLNMELRLARLTPVTTTNTFGRPYAYAGVAGYEAAVPGMAGYNSLVGQLNGLAGLPKADQSQIYCWPLSANAALAAVNRSMFANTSPANLAAIDSLEAANKTVYQTSQGAEVSSRSAEFGKQVAAAVLAWAKTDGYDNATPRPRGPVCGCLPPRSLAQPCFLIGVPIGR